MVGHYKGNWSTGFEEGRSKMVNVVNVGKVIKALEEVEDERFDISSYFSEVGNRKEKDVYRLGDFTCDTAACVGGWTCVVRWREEGGEDSISIPRSIKAAEFLGLGLGEADKLFYPRGVDWSRLGRKEAIRTLERLRDEGVVDWTEREGEE